MTATDALALPIGAPGDVPPCIRHRPFAIAGSAGPSGFRPSCHGFQQRWCSQAWPRLRSRRAAVVQPAAGLLRASSESTASGYDEGGSDRGQAIPSAVSRNREKQRMARGRLRKQREGMQRRRREAAPRRAMKRNCGTGTAPVFHRVTCWQWPSSECSQMKQAFGLVRFARSRTNCFAFATTGPGLPLSDPSCF